MNLARFAYRKHSPAHHSLKAVTCEQWRRFSFVQIYVLSICVAGHVGRRTNLLSSPFFFSSELSARFSLQQNDNAQAIYLCHFNGVGYVFDRLRVCRSCFSFEAKTKRKKNTKWKWDDDKDHAMSAPETSKKLYIRKRSRTERGKMQNVYSLECRSMMWIRKFSRVCLQLVRSFGFPLCGQIGGDGAAAAASNTMTMRMDIGPLSMRRAHAFMQPSNFYDWKKRLCCSKAMQRQPWLSKWLNGNL